MHQASWRADSGLSWIFVMALASAFFIVVSEQLFAGVEVEATQQPEEVTTPPLLVGKERSLKQVGPKMVQKTVSGKVGAKGANGMSLVTETKEDRGFSAEMWFNFGEDSKLNSVKEGELVTIVYVQAEDGSKRVIKKVKRKNK